MRVYGRTWATLVLLGVESVVLIPVFIKATACMHTQRQRDAAVQHCTRASA